MRGLKHLRRINKLLARLHDDATARDRAGIGVQAVDPGGGRSGIHARSVVTADMRFREALVWGVVFIVCAVAVWLLTPQRVWSWKCRLTSRWSGPAAGSDS